MEVFEQVLLSLGGTEELLRLRHLHHLGEGPRVVHLHMVHDDVIDPFRWQDLGDPLEELCGEGGLHSIEERHLFVHH